MFEISMTTIERHYSPGIGRHWFDADTLRFFSSRIADTAYVSGEYRETLDGAAYFVSSERRRGCARLYTVRRYDFATQDISTVGEFQGYASRSGAVAAAKRHAKHCGAIETLTCEDCR
jgi:hypothetical protein